MNTWLLRAVWILLPVTAGEELSAALRSWSDAPRLTASVMLWVLWALVLGAVMVPRPVAMTIVRIGAPLAFVVTVIAAFASEPSTVSIAVAILMTLLACGLGLRGEFPRVCAQGAAYGDEERFPLKVPPGITWIMLPGAILVIGAGIATGPLLIADGTTVVGIVLTLLGWPLAAFVTRLVHQLARRWLVLVPAGLVIADPLTLTDPVLFVREKVQGLGPADPTRRAPDDALDLRLGAAYGSCAVLLQEEAPLLRRVRGRAEGVHAGLLLVAPADSERFLARAAARHLAVHQH
jgi:hypothetical protein